MSFQEYLTASAVIQSFMADSDVDYDVTFFTKSYHSYFWR